MRVKMSLLAAAGLLFAGIASSSAFSKHPRPSRDLVDTAVQAGSFDTLVKAVKEAGLVDALKGKGPLTVFAPTDEAFAALPDGALQGLLADKAKLKAVLLYHVVPGRVLAKDAVKLDSAKTLQGDRVAISVDGHGVTVNDARVVKTDVLASNGVIHVIDRVLLPPEQMSKSEACRAVITRAIHLGVPMYNDGDHAACAAIYEVAAMSVMSFAAEDMPDGIRAQLRHAMQRAKKSHDADERAWILRRGLDAVNRAMATSE